MGTGVVADDDGPLVKLCVPSAIVPPLLASSILCRMAVVLLVGKKEDKKWFEVLGAVSGNVVGIGICKKR